ncbi:MAG TPA: serine/threonine-protein kinase [Polyangia bacterium]|jgi:serine/threonine protein kinase|nr:serine/threonine-protein kinase [Polyangia bacterium]
MTAGPDLYASGEKLGRYQLIQRLAVGGMAEIFLARLVAAEGFEKLVVVKRILPQHALDPELLRMFLDEARLTATLTHPHVTQVYDVGQGERDGAGEAPFFAMEYVHGANLRQLMQAHGEAGPLPLEHAIGIVAAAAAGLHYAHEKRGPEGEALHIVHRDVSPSNVLVSFDGAVKVSDFGIAKWAHQRTQTQEGALKGKFGYMSPEQCRGRPLDARSDVFALGTILYELTTGEAPFTAPSDFEILSKIIDGPISPPRRPDGAPYPPALADIVMRALARDPAARTPTAQALQLELEAFARQERLEVSTVALGALMQRLFADELAAWREAQRAGKSLGDHLAELQARRPAGPRTATDAFAAPPAPPPAPNRWGFAAAIGVALAALGVFISLARGGASSPAPRAPSTPAQASAPAPAARDVSTAMTAGNNVEGHASASALAPVASGNVTSSVRGPDPGAPRRAARARAARPPATPAPSNAESRLHAWDPDSPVPP